MLLIAIIVGSGVAAAVAAFAVSASKRIDVPLDPATAERAVKRSIRHHPRVRRFLEQRMDRASAGGFLLTVGFGLVFAAALVLGVLLVLIDRNDAVRDVDREVSEWGAAHADSGAIDAVELITYLGSTPVVLAVLAVVATADFVRRRNRDVFLFVAAVQFGELLLNNLLKVSVRRERPAVLQVMEADGFAFPSGHTAAAAAGWSAVALVLGRDRSQSVRSILAGGAALIAVAVATSRALLGVHWVSDVIGGLVLGWGWFLLVAVVFGGRVQRLGDPVVDAAHDTAHDTVHRGANDRSERARVAERVDA